MGDSCSRFTAPMGTTPVMTLHRPCQCRSRGPESAARRAVTAPPTTCPNMPGYWGGG